MDEKRFSRSFEQFIDFLSEQMVTYYMRGGFFDGKQYKENSPGSFSGEECPKLGPGQCDQGRSLPPPEHDRWTES
ncbi:MAG: hypothetical protein A3I05_08800 [Deltaproteobacteria bacterium RIFCSPLOWO2_02_FULL_44_10]|nr:MAG: hypothetical protein A3C46_02330 [Deltaproteobacteria bacterium RIFCSPHIGHO2_02_FULL_44_16]OGQ45794.1 MAG: hypothetical protein A3I05_08800 [Deltaproteobacteria bacterium RIFCSPLOWO2_02_FULL_44_10]